MDPSDEVLVERVRSGERDAFTCLVRRWDARVLNLAYRLIGDAEDAQDVRQAAFIRAYSAMGRFSNKARFSTWLYRIVVNLCRDRGRRRQAGERAVNRYADGAAVDEASVSAGLATNARKELRDVVAHAVAMLPPHEREVVVLRHFQEQTFREVAETLDLPVATAKSRMMSAVQRLRAEFDRSAISPET